jgi:hypothetical protein
MRRVFAGFAVAVALSGAAALFMASPSDVSAAPGGKGAGRLAEGVFLVPANDGYGIADCIAEKRSCGRSVAETWCQSHGFRTALSFGVADRADFTGSVPRADANGQMPIVISCGE